MALYSKPQRSKKVLHVTLTEEAVGLLDFTDVAPLWLFFFGRREARERAVCVEAQRVHQPPLSPPFFPRRLRCACAFGGVTAVSDEPRGGRQEARPGAARDPVPGARHPRHRGVYPLVHQRLPRGRHRGT